jgi:hypothetical protein
MCFVWLSEQTVTFALYIINKPVFMTEVGSVYSAVQTEFLYNTDTSRPLGLNSLFFYGYIPFGGSDKSLNYSRLGTQKNIMLSTTNAVSSKMFKCLSASDVVTHVCKSWRRPSKVQTSYKPWFNTEPVIDNTMACLYRRYSITDITSSAD